ncbi:MAG TPA: hypothetical protein VGZ93_04980 [Candidatus Methylacidiphilales bacterium]|jgi:hypothetical protein|nr:hypothetical protein [Candidatus Methylacidiphilales bacterium]
MKYPQFPFYEYGSNIAMQLHHSEVKFAKQRGEPIRLGWIGFKTEVPSKCEGRQDENRLGRAYIRPDDTKIDNLSLVNEEFILNEAQFARLLKHPDGRVFYLSESDAKRQKGIKK